MKIIKIRTCMLGVISTALFSACAVQGGSMPDVPSQVPQHQVVRFLVTPVGDEGVTWDGRGALVKDTKNGGHYRLVQRMLNDTALVDVSFDAPGIQFISSGEGANRQSIAVPARVKGNNELALKAGQSAELRNGELLLMTIQRVQED